MLISWEVDELTSKQERVSSCRQIFGKIHYPFTPSLFYSFTPPLPDSLLLYSLLLYSLLPTYDSTPYYLLLYSLLLTPLLLTPYYSTPYYSTTYYLLLTTYYFLLYYLLLPPLLSLLTPLLLPPLLLIPFSRHNNVLLQTNGAEFQIISYLCPVLRT